MALLQLTQFPVAPATPPDSSAQFTEKADAHTLALETFITESNALSTNNEVRALASASSASLASASETNSGVSETAAGVSETNASDSKDVAEAANASIGAAPGLPTKTSHSKEALKVNAGENGVEWQKGDAVAVMSTSTAAEFYTAPDFLLCDGSIYSSGTYPELFAAIGTTTLPNIDVGGYPHTKTYIKASS